MADRKGENKSGPVKLVAPRLSVAAVAPRTVGSDIKANRSTVRQRLREQNQLADIRKSQIKEQVAVLVQEKANLRSKRVVLEAEELSTEGIDNRISAINQQIRDVRSGKTLNEEKEGSIDQDRGAAAAGDDGLVGGLGFGNLEEAFKRNSRIQGPEDPDIKKNRESLQSRLSTRTVGANKCNSMGLGGQLGSTIFKRKFRWLFNIPGIAGNDFTGTGNASRGSSADPPSLNNGAFVAFKGARPSLSFKEMTAQHLNETIYYPAKPDWKPLTLTLYDTTNAKSPHPVFEWLKTLYYPGPNKEASFGGGSWRPSCAPAMAQGRDATSSSRSPKGGGFFKIPEATLKLFDGCGNVLEMWTFENVWPQSIDFGELDMGNSEVVTVDLTLKYDRAFLNFVTLTPPLVSPGTPVVEEPGQPESRFINIHNAVRQNCGVATGPIEGVGVPDVLGVFV